MERGDTSTGRFKTPANAAIAVGVLAAIPFIVTGAGTAIYIAIAATGMIYISYFLCNLGVLVARRRGWPHQGAWFKLGRWGTIINILALVWGGLMVINIAIWTDPNLFGVCRQRPAQHVVEPVHQQVHQVRGTSRPAAGLADLRDARRRRAHRRSALLPRRAAREARQGRSRPTRRPARRVIG